MSETDYPDPEDVLEHLKETKAVILQGPPGTGKTYTAKEVIKEVKEKKGENKKQSSEEHSGDDDYDLHEYQWTSISGKDYDAHEIEEEELNCPDGEDLSSLNVIWELVQLHPSYSYEDFVRGIEIETKDSENDDDDDEGDSENENNNGLRFNFKESDRTVVQLAKVAEMASDGDEDGEETPVVLILDEINRCNLSDVLGELILTLEEDKRGDEWPVRLQYPPPESDGKGGFEMPENLYVIGTMNTADQSIAKIDYAIRRRFRFIDVLPDKSQIGGFYREDHDGAWFNEIDNEDFEMHKEELDEVIYVAEKIMNDINERIEKNQLEIGHSHFLVKNVIDEVDEPAGEPELPELLNRWARTQANRLAYDVLPLLQEYHRNREISFDDGDSDGDIQVDLADKSNGDSGNSGDENSADNGDSDYEFEIHVTDREKSQKEIREDTETAIRNSLDEGSDTDE